MSIKDKILDLIRRPFGTRRIIEGISKLKKESAFYHYEHRRYQLIEHILHDTNMGVTSEKYTDHDIIVSLTTYGKRIHDVAFTIESIMQQTMKANRIILWLDYSFKGARLPQSLLNQQKRGLEIAYCDDIRSYKKIIPCLKAYPDDAIITLDDDLLYDYDLIEHLIVSYLQSPQYIHSCRGHQMGLNQDGQLQPYKKWKKRLEEQGISTNYFFTSGGGTLFPPHCLDSEVLNKNVFTTICPYADDVWLNAMALRKGTQINRVYTRNPKGDDFIVNEGVQDIGLLQINAKGEMLNDTQLKAVFTKYSLYDKLR